MKNNSINVKNINLLHYRSQNNCDCYCHSPEKIETNHCHSQERINNIHSLKLSHCRSYSHSPDHAHKKSYNNISIKNFRENIIGCPCICQNLCNYPFHCVTCFCCHCHQEKIYSNENQDNIYRSLYSQIKTELEYEKNRNDKDSKSKSSQYKKKKILYENKRLKNKLSKAISKIEKDKVKYNKREEELYNFKNEKIPKMKGYYENIIKKLKEENNKPISSLKNQIYFLAKENLSLKYQRKIRHSNDNEYDKIIQGLKIQINNSGMELENKNNIIDELKNENEELNNKLEEINFINNREIIELKRQNQELNEIISLNEEKIKRLKNELYLRCC